jgi:hypothetical protein
MIIIKVNDTTMAIVAMNILNFNFDAKIKLIKIIEKKFKFYILCS